MQLQLYAIRDAKAEYFRHPHFMKTQGEALRNFMDGIGDAQTELAKHPEDFALFHLATLDENTGIVTPLIQPVQVALGLDFVNKD